MEGENTDKECILLDLMLSLAKITPRAVPSGSNRVLLRPDIRLGSARSNPCNHFSVVSLDHIDLECQPVGGIQDRRRSPSGPSLCLAELAGRNRFPLRGVPPPRGCLLLVILPRRSVRWVSCPKDFHCQSDWKVQHHSRVVMGSWHLREFGE